MKRIDQPLVGTFRIKLAKGGIDVAVLIGRAPDGQLIAQVAGVDVDAFEVWPFCVAISEAEFHFLERRRLWAEQHDPGHPAAQPYRAVDVRSLKPSW